jgi:uncharacterized membrane protein HdeD (DUF308 family)
MTDRESFSPKKLSVLLAILGCGLITAYVIFIGVISIRVGVRHLEKDGFWMPILAGGLCILFILFLFSRFTRFFYHLTKSSERLQL